MTFGVVNEGFVKKDFNTLRDEKQQYFKNTFGEAINVNEPSIFSNIIDILAYFEAESWEKLQSIYNSQYIDTAEGTSLDNLATLIGITRLLPTYTTVNCQLTTENNVNITQGSKVRISNTEKIFSLINEITISNIKCYKIKLIVQDGLAEDTEVTVTLNGNNYTYTVLADDTASDIASNLSTAINQAALFTALHLDNTLTVTSLELNQTFACFFNAEQIEIDEITANALFRCDDAGAIIVPSFAIDTIENNIAGWRRVGNIQAGVTGRDLESDNELRARCATSKVRGSGSVEAIRSRLLNINGVLSANVIQNDQLEEVDGLPAKSIRALVLGGNDQDIAQELWNSKPAGIRLFGNTNVNITDSQGIEHTIYFSRAVNKYIFTKIVLTVTEDYDENNDAIIKQEVTNKINDFGVGNVILYQSLFGSVYDVDHVNIINATIRIASSDNEQIPADNQFNSANITIQNNQIPITDINKVIITKA